MSAAAVVWAVVNELLIQPREYTCFNLTLERLRDDSRVTVRLGTPVSGYGQESRNRQARQRIPHRTFVDQDGVEHTQVSEFGSCSALSYLLNNPRHAARGTHCEQGVAFACLRKRPVGLQSQSQQIWSGCYCTAWTSSAAVRYG